MLTSTKQTAIKAMKYILIVTTQCKPVYYPTTKSLHSEVKKACMMLVAFFAPSVSQDVVALLKKLQIPAGDGGGGGCVRQSALPKKFFAATWMDI